MMQDPDVDNAERAALEISRIERPDWDTYFMTMAFLVGMRSPDRETKVGCVIVDNPSKIPIGFGFNGHPRGCDGLPTLRPEKYAVMVHADSNALINSVADSDDATMYLPMPPCERCFGLILNSTRIKIKRIVYYWGELSTYPHTEALSKLRPDVEFAQFTTKFPGGVMGTLEDTKSYVFLHDNYGAAMRATSAKSF